MGKKEKQIKNKVKYQTAEQEEIKKFIIVILVVLICVGAIYLITRAFVTKDLGKSDDTTEQTVTGTVNYDVAIMGQILNRPYKSYYVVIYDTDGEYMSDMSSMVNNYNTKEEHLHMYTVDLNNHLNASYYDPENVNQKATDLADLKVGDITLLKIKDGKISKFVVDYTKMLKELGL